MDVSNVHIPFDLSFVLKVCDVEWQDLRSWVEKMGGFAVIKIPYSNAGQGVYTITSEKEMQEFEEAEKGNSYQKFVVQSLIANYTWSSKDQGGNALYHVGTMPDKRGDIYVADLRYVQDLCVSRSCER